MGITIRAIRPDEHEADVQGFYEKLGFRVSTIAMERVRRSEPQAGDEGATP